MSRRRTLNVDEETYLALREKAEKLKIGISAVLRIIVLNDIPLSALDQIVQRETPAGKAKTIENISPAPAHPEVKKEPVTKEVNQEAKVVAKQKEEATKEKKEDDWRANRPVGKDYKKFFAERFGIPYDSDKD